MGDGMDGETACAFDVGGISCDGMALEGDVRADVPERNVVCVRMLREGWLMLVLGKSWAIDQARGRTCMCVSASFDFYIWLANMACAFVEHAGNSGPVSARIDWAMAHQCGFQAQHIMQYYELSQPYLECDIHIFDSVYDDGPYQFTPSLGRGSRNRAGSTRDHGAHGRSAAPGLVRGLADSLRPKGRASGELGAGRGCGRGGRSPSLEVVQCRQQLGCIACSCRDV